jgi:mannose-1-phosphate guanylyltransferase
MFVWKTSTILDEFARYMPELHTGCMQLVEQQCSPSAMDRFYRERRKESIDYGIMEKSDRVAVIRGDFEWDDVGSWEAMSRLHPPATEGTTVVGERVFDTDCSDTIIVNKSDKYIAALGLEDITVVATDDALLVIPRSKLPDIKKYLGEMKSSGRFPEHLF